jgi:AcrR family transcriptional regulator
MRQRATQVDGTRRRITEAAVRLHTTVGPSEASFAAVAEAAGVTRLTLYRHFAGRDELFAACMTHWRAAHPPPDPGGWAEARTFEARLRRAVTELYAWYAENHADLYPIYRDAAFTPAATDRARRENIERMADAILAQSSAPARHLVRAAIGHVLGFWAWRSLAVEEGCSHAQAVELAVRFVLSAAKSSRQRDGDGSRLEPT